MRIALSAIDPTLEAALRELLASAGHDVLAPGITEGAELLVRRSPYGLRPGAHAVLSLRPRLGGRPDPSPAVALARVLREGGEAVWDAPIDPGVLLSLLAGGKAPAPPPPPPPPSVSSEAPRQPATAAQAEGADVEVIRLLEELAALRGVAELGRVTSTFAHEIRNPLASLASAVDLLAKDLVPAERADVARMARSRLSQMKSLLDDTLRLARPLRGPPTVFDPIPALASAVDIARSDPRFQGVEVRFDPAGDPLEVRSYEEPLRQAVLNLLVNAVEAQGSSGTIEVSLAREDAGRIAVRVRDGGPGIPQDLRAKVFDPFWTTKAAGTGLGLAFVRRLAEGSGGAVDVEDVPPPGACLRILLPRA